MTVIVLLCDIFIPFPSRGRGARATPLGARFLRIIATRVEMALTVTIPTIHSGSRSYVIDLQSETIGIAVSFSIAAFD